ncbi:MAG: hypothetical protein E6Q99_02870, partial [Elusimicrobia bacterium]
MTAPGNFAARVRAIAQSDPDRTALLFPRRGHRRPRDYGRVTFGHIEALSDRYAAGLSGLGVRRGDRVLLLVPVGPDLLAFALALLKIGAVLVLIDPGMGVRALLDCVDRVGPDALIAVPKVHALRCFVRRPFATVRHAVTVGRRWGWGGASSRAWRGPVPPVAMADVGRDALGAIVFTTGSTGVPKGVHYTHGVFDAQVEFIQNQYHRGDRTGLAAFPTMALYYLAMGIPCVLPPVNPARVARVDPADVLDALDRFEVTSGAGSPMFWEPVVRHCRALGRGPRDLRTVTMFGAPVRAELLEDFKAVLAPGGDTHTPYGATEALPVTTLAGSEILRDTRARTRAGAGVCVGRPFPGLTVRVIPLTDEPLPTWNERLGLPPGVIGEIVVKGPIVTAAYDRRERETALAKIREGDAVWHRMGDAGYFDSEGRLWYCGRKSHRVETVAGPLFSVPVEEIFNAHPGVRRTALIGLGERPRQRPVLVVEPRPGASPRTARARS